MSKLVDYWCWFFGFLAVLAGIFFVYLYFDSAHFLFKIEPADFFSFGSHRKIILITGIGWLVLGALLIFRGYLLNKFYEKEGENDRNN